jgi:hypothetical protein
VDDHGRGKQVVAHHRARDHSHERLRELNESLSPYNRQPTTANRVISPPHLGLDLRTPQFRAPPPNRDGSISPTRSIRVRSQEVRTTPYCWPLASMSRAPCVKIVQQARGVHSYPRLRLYIGEMSHTAPDPNNVYTLYHRSASKSKSASIELNLKLVKNLYELLPNVIKLMDHQQTM